MGQKEYDAFKQQLREWMDKHQTEYDQFEAEMNRKDNEGYQMILFQAMALAPEFMTIINRRINRTPDDDLSDIKKLLAGNDLIKSIEAGFDKPFDESFVTAMFCWLFFGQSFERMVERGEEIRKRQEASMLEKMQIKQVLGIIIESDLLH